jgi:hypothetical protein
MIETDVTSAPVRVKARHRVPAKFSGNVSGSIEVAVATLAGMVVLIVVALVAFVAASYLAS